MYDLPLSSLSATIDKLYINSSRLPVPLAQKYPQLGSSPEFVQAREHFYNCFTAVDEEGEYLLFTTKYDRCQQCSGATYDLTGERTYSGLTYMGKDDQVLISSNALNQFYAINRGGEGLEMMRFHFSANQVKGASIEPDTPSVGFYRMCALDGGGGNQIKVVDTTSPPDECRPLTWPVLKGFIADSKFYLFGENYIFTFPSSVYEQQNEPVKYESIPYGEFIQCEGRLDPKALVPSAGSSPTRIALIIALVLAIVLVLLCLLLCLMREAAERRRQQQQAKNKNGGGDETKEGVGAARAGSDGSKKTNRSKNSRKAQLGGDKSARSGDDGAFGFLTGLFGGGAPAGRG